MNTLQSLFHWIVDASLRASILTVIVLLVQSALRGCLSARWRYALWLPVLLVLVLPVLPHSRWSAENAMKTFTKPPSTVALVLPAEEAAIPYSSPIKPAFVRDWKEMAAIVWAAGALIAFSAGLLSCHAMRRRFTANAVPADDSMMTMINSLCAGLRMLRAPRVLFSTAVESAAVTGVLHPVMLLPADFTTVFNLAEARLVLKHELMHLKRLDLQVNAVLCLLHALHWFNPILWLAAWRVRQDREAACDAQVLASNPHDCRSDYGHALLKVQSSYCRQGFSLGFLGIFEHGRSLRSRIEAIARFRRPNPAGGMVAMTVIVLLAVLGATRAQITQAQTVQPPTSRAQGAQAAKAAIEDKLGRIIVPHVNMMDASVREALDFLQMQSRKFDADPAHQGVTILAHLDPQKEQAKITLDLRNVSLRAALESIAAIAGLSIEITPEGVIVSAKPAGKPGAAAQTPAGTTAIVDRLNKIILPKVSFQNVTACEALDFLQMKSRELSGDPARDGVNIVTNLDPRTDQARVTMELRNAPLREALDLVANIAGLSIEITPEGVVVAARHNGKPGEGAR